MEKNLKKVLVLGSGALKIGQAGEFDYSGSQALMISYFLSQSALSKSLIYFVILENSSYVAQNLNMLCVLQEQR